MPVIRHEDPDLEESMMDVDVYVGDEHSSITGPSPHDIEAIHNRSLSKRVMENKLLFGLGAFVILLASIPILLFGINNFSISKTNSQTSSVQLVNDVCLSAVKLDSSRGPIMASTAGASRDDDVEGCGVDLGSGPSVWFKVLGTGGPVKVIKDDEQAFTNQISVYGGHCKELSCLTGDNLKGSVLFNTERDRAYFVRVSGVNAASGNFHISLEDLSQVSGDKPVNDVCEDSIGLATDGSIYTATTETATFDMEGAGTCYRTSNAGPGVWYDVIGTGGSLIATANSSTTLLAVFTGSCDNVDCQTASDLAEGIESFVQWDSELAQRYHILAHSIGGQKGAPFEISVSDSRSQDEHFVVNDFCKGAIGPVASDGSVLHGSTEHATYDTDGAGTCYPEMLAGAGVWFSVKGIRGSLKVYPDKASVIDPLVSVFKGECRKLKCVEGTQHTIDDQERKVLSWASDEEEMYFLLVRGYDNVKGSFQLTVESEIAPEEEVPEQQAVHDYCESAIDVPYIDTVVTGSTINATNYMDGIGMCHSQKNAGPGVWYRVAGNGKALRIATTDASDLAAFFSVYGGDCEDLVCVEDTKGDLRAQQSFAWKTTLGVSYYVLVQGQFQASGAFEFIVEEDLAPNDECAGALGPIPTNGTTWYGSNELASPDTIGSGTCYPTNQTGNGVWYTVMGTGGTLDILTKGVDFAVSVSVFGGFSCDNLSCIASDYVQENKAGVLGFNSVHNVAYYILVNGVGDALGSFELLVLPTKNEATDGTEHVDVEIDVITDNDRCEAAEGPLSSSDTVLSGTTANTKTMEVNLPDGSCSGTGGLGRWYTVQGADTTLSASVSSFAITTSAGIAVYSGGCGGLVCVTGIDSGADAGAAKSVSWDSTSDVTYYIFVHSPPESTGAFELKLEHSQGVTHGGPPANDVCTTAFSVSPGALYEGSMAGATRDVATSASCHGNSNVGPGVWHKMTGDGRIWSLVEIQTYTSNAISIYSGSCGSLVCLTSHTEGHQGTLNSHSGTRGPISWPTNVGETYYILVESLSMEVAPVFGFTITESNSTSVPAMAAPSQAPTTEAPLSPPSAKLNDNCADAIGPLEVGGNLAGAFNRDSDNTAGTCGTAPNDNAGMWFTMMGTGAGIRISTCRGFNVGSEAPGTDTSYASVSVYQGCDDLQCLAGSNDTCTDSGLIEWNTEENEAYHVLVSGDEDAMEDGYMMLHDQIDWTPRNCLDAPERFIEELDVLEEFFTGTGNTKDSGALFHRGWLKGCDVCKNWDGLECDNQDRITQLQLAGVHYKLTGFAPTVLRGLKELTVLDLADNDLEGTLHKDMGGMKKLETLNLRGNKFIGQLPKEFSKLKDLVHFDLNSNLLTGAIPDDFSKLNSIELFSMGNNTLSGTLPSSFGELDSLKVLRVHKNNLEGPIPSELGQLTQLASLDLHANQFTGTMPAELCALRTSGVLTSLTADCGGDSPAVSCPSDCCTQCH